jgi:hypothetical protein
VIRALPGRAALATALLAAACASAPGPRGPDSARTRRTLADFETEGTWTTSAAGPSDEIQVETGEDASGERPGRVLHVRFAFGEADAGEVAARVELPDVDASDYDQLAFWIRGEAPAGSGESVQIRVHRRAPFQTGSFVVGGIGNRWQRVVIPLGRMPGIGEWRHLSELVLRIQARRVGIARGGYDLDDIELLRSGQPGPSASDPVLTPAKRAWEAAAGSRREASKRLRQRLGGWPARAAVDPAELPAERRAFLWRLARDSWRGLDALTDRESGLPVDNVHFEDGSTGPAEARVGDFTNVTNVGLRLMAITAAHDLGLISRTDALARLDRLLDTLDRLESYRGFFFNYYDTTSLERSSNFVSFVDSAWLTAGLLVARTAFPEVEARCSRLVERGDYALFYDPVEQLMSHGTWVHLDVPAEYHYGTSYTEARIGSLIAIGKGDVPPEHWTRLMREFQASRSRRRWRGIAFVPSWGGSLFEALMPVLVLDEPRLAPQTLGRNDEAHAVIQRRYAEEELGYSVWGLSPSATPGTGAYGEYGARPLGRRSYPAGVVAPYASALALAVTPGPAEANLRRLAGIPGAYGDYGLYDAIDPLRGTVARAYLALDQSMLFLALANQLGEGCVRRHFAADPIVARALPLVADERLLH